MLPNVIVIVIALVVLVMVAVQIVREVRRSRSNGRAAAAPPSGSLPVQAVYEAEAVLNHKLLGQSRRVHYLVHWRGYPSSEDTWEPAEHLRGCVLLTDYEQTRSRREAARRRHRGQR